MKNFLAKRYDRYYVQTDGGQPVRPIFSLRRFKIGKVIRRFTQRTRRICQRLPTEALNAPQNKNTRVVFNTGII